MLCLRLYRCRRGARVGATEARLGMAGAPVNLAWLIPRVGYNAAVQIAQSAKLYNGRELKEMGLAFSCAPDDRVLETGRALADELCQTPLPAMAAMKRTIQRAGSLDFPGLLKRIQNRNPHDSTSRGSRAFPDVNWCDALDYFKSQPADQGGPCAAQQARTRPHRPLFRRKRAAG